MALEIFDDTLDEEDRAEIKRLQGPLFVIGASGFIGAKLFFALKKVRDDVFGASTQMDRSWRLGHFPREKSRGFLVNLDITDAKKVDELIQRYKPRTVFNLAAYGAYERESNSHRIHQVNYIGTMNLMHSLFNAGCDGFVHAGSSSEYGINCQAPKETDELRPNSDYSVSKGATALLIRFYGTIKQFPCVNLRLYSIYGPWEDRDRLIPKLVVNGLASSLPPFADKNISRDFLYIDDCIRALVRAALTVCKKDPGLSLNIATGTKTSLEEVAGCAKSIFKISEEPRFGAMQNRKWDLSNWFGDPSLAFEKMNWKSKISFREGLLLTAEWERLASGVIRIGTVPKKSKKVSAIIACYRDHQAIPIMYEGLTKTFEDIGVDYEIIFVNDHSPTQDEDIIREICIKDSHVIGVSHSRNFGSQSAFISGMEVASGDAVVLMDGDLQDPPEVIPQFVKKWEEGFDVVYGVRSKRVAVWYMQILYKVFYRLFKKFADFEIPLDAGDFSLIDQKVVEQLVLMPEKDVFLRGLRAWVGFKQTGIPYVRPERRFGRTTNSLMKNIWWAKKGIFSFSLKPLFYIQSVAVGIFLISMLLAAFYLLYYFISPPQNARGVTTIIILVLGLGGVQLFSLSILGDYLGKVLEEVKNRPKFIRSKIITTNEVMETQDKMIEFMKRSMERSGGKYRG